MKIGIIGCGGMGTTHYLSLRALAEQEGVEVTCIAECHVLSCTSFSYVLLRLTW